MAEMPPVRVELIADIKEFMAKMKEAEHSIHNVGEAGKTTGEKLGFLGNKLANYTLAGIGGAAILATKYAYDYSKSLEEIQMQASVSEEEMKRLKTQILDVSTATATSNDLIAKAYLQVEKAGISGARADEMVTQAAKLAKVAHADLSQTISAGLVIQNLHLSGIKNTTDLYNQLYGAVKNSRLSLDEISGIFQGKAALALSNYGIKLGETVAVASVFKKANMDANAGIAGLNLGLVKLTTRNAKTNDTLKEVGLTQAQLAGDLKKPNGLVRVFEDLYTHIGKAGYPMQQFLNNLVGARGAQGFGYLLRNLPEIQKALGTGAASINDAFGEWLKNPEGTFAQFSTTLKNTLTKAGDLFLPYATRFVGIIGKGLSEFSKNPSWQRTGMAIGAGLLTFLGSMKLMKIGAGIATAFGAEATAAAIMNPIGIAMAAAFAAALVSVIRTPQGGRAFKNLITGQGPGGRGQAAKDLAGAAWNIFPSLTSPQGFINALFGHPQYLPKFLQYHPSLDNLRPQGMSPTTRTSPSSPFDLMNPSTGALFGRPSQPTKTTNTVKVKVH